MILPIKCTSPSYGQYLAPIYSNKCALMWIFLSPHSGLFSWFKLRQSWYQPDHVWKCTCAPCLKLVQVYLVSVNPKEFPIPVIYAGSTLVIG